MGTSNNILKNHKNIFRLIVCYIITNMFEINENYIYLIGTILASIFQLQHINYNNIYIWLENFKNLHDNIIRVHKLVIKISNDFCKVKLYIIHRWIHLSHSFI